SVPRLLRLPEVAPQACVRGDFAPGRTPTRRRAVSRLQRRVRVRRCRHPRPLAAPAGPVRPEGIAPAAVRWPRARRTGCLDSAPLWGGADRVPRGAPLPGTDRGEPLPPASPPLGEPRASTHLLHPPPARVDGHARDVGYPPDHLRGRALLRLGPD